MFGFMVTADGGLTTAGYVITIIAGIPTAEVITLVFITSPYTPPKRRLRFAYSMRA